MTSDDLDPVWKALANSDRRRLLDALNEGHLTTGQLCAELPHLSRFAVMQHLTILEEAELIVVRRSGRERHNHLNPVPIQQIADRWISRYQRPVAEALIDLKHALESGDDHDQTDQTDQTETGGASA